MNEKIYIKIERWRKEFILEKKILLVMTPICIPNIVLREAVHFNQRIGF
jgi:hypothetical protein